MKRAFRLRRDPVSEVREEMALHVALRVEQLVAEGWSRDAAETEARRRFAADEAALTALYASARGRSDAERWRERIESWLQDVRYAARALRRDPLLTLFAVVALSLGIGANLTSFGLVDRLLMRPPAHVHDSERVVRLYGTVEWDGAAQTSSWIPYPVYEALRESVPRSLTRVGAYRVRDGLGGRGANSVKLRVGQTLGDYFAALGTPAALGRVFGAHDDETTAGPQAVLSDRVWRARYGAARDALGAQIEIDGKAYTIVGVTPPEFEGTDARRVDVWLLGDTRTARFNNWNIVGRMNDGAVTAEVSSEAHALFRRSAEAAPEWYRAAVIEAGPLRFGDSGREPIETTIARWFAIVTAAILAVTFANVVSLLLVRLARRERELAVRLSLGSGRGRVMRLLALEGTLLALAGGVGSLLVALLIEPAVRTALFADTAGWTFRLLDPRVLIMLACFLAMTILLVGLVPALRLGTPRLMTALRTGSQGDARSSAPLRSALTVLQAGLSVVLLVGAGLFVLSIARVNAVDMGVDRQQVWTADVTYPRPDDPRAIFDDFPAHLARERARFDALGAAVAALPWVERTSVAIGLPLDGGSFGANVFLPGRDSVPSLPGGPYASVVDDRYFEAVGTAVLRGRAFTGGDGAGTEPVVIVNETMARTLWPQLDPLAQCVQVGSRGEACRRVVGVVEDVHRVGLHEQPSMQFYLPHGQQEMFGGAMLLVRTRDGATASAQDLRAALLRADAGILGLQVQPLAESIGAEVRPLRLGLVTFGLSGVIALLVAIVGLYSLMSYLVASRTREIGVRAAIGATHAQITRLVIARGTSLAGAGIGLGLALAIGAGRWLEPHLYETRAADPLVLAAVAAGLLLVAIAAGLMPARRALRISPTEALRSE